MESNHNSTYEAMRPPPSIPPSIAMADIDDAQVQQATPSSTSSAAASTSQHSRFFPQAAPAAAIASTASSTSIAIPSSVSSRSSPPREFQVVWQGHWKSNSVAATRNADAMETDETKESDQQQQQEQDDPRMQSREYKLSAESYEQLVTLIHTHFPTSPQHPILLTDEEQKELNEEKFHELKNHDVVLVFEASRPADASITYQWAKVFEHIPHPSVVTYSQELIAEEGRGASAAVVYALAEFCDNSISALRKYRKDHPTYQAQGTIRISFMQDRRSNWSIAIEDDGCGMSSATLQAFSRMGDAPSYRGEAREKVDPDATNHYLNINISQWGIGAKSAGFFIGDNIIVSSRAPELKQVLECAMSQKRMFADHKKTGNAFRDEMSRRAIGDAASYPDKQPHPYMSHLIRSEAQARQGDHFTRICVTGVEERHSKKLTDIDTVANELADIYNRFLHGPLGRDDNGVSNVGKVWMSPRILLESVQEDTNSPNGFKVVKTIDLRKVATNDTSRYQLMRRGQVFRFHLDVKAPITETHSSEIVKDSHQARIMGEIYYLPRSVDGETHIELKKKQDAKEEQLRKDHPPEDEDRHHIINPTNRTRRTTKASAAASTSAAAAAAASTSAASSSSVIPASKDRVDAEGNLIMEEESAPTFDVYWHGRLIPLSHINKLFFMKLSPENRECLARMKGYLFFSFPFLTSRNKLSFAERNLQAYLNDAANLVRAEILDQHSNFIPGAHRTSQAIQKKWTETLAGWRQLDANYEWNQRYYLPEDSKAQGKELYSQVSLHGSVLPEFAVLKRGNIYRTQAPSAKKPEWLKAIFFERPTATSNSSDTSSDSQLGGAAKIWGVLMPLESRQENRVKSLRFLDKEKPLIEQKREYEAHVALIMAGEPARIEVWMVPRNLLKSGAIYYKTAGFHFPGTAIAVFGHEHEGKSRVIGSSEKAQLEIRHFTLDFPQEEDDDDDVVMSDENAPRVKRSSNRNATAASASATSSRPQKRAKVSRTARPRRVRRAGRGSDDESADEEECKSADDDEEDEEEDTIAAQRARSAKDDDRPGETVPFRDTAKCMNRDIAEAVTSHGKNVEIMDDVAAAAAVARSTAVVTKKRKNAATTSDELGRNGFEPYHFHNNTAMGRYLFTFDLPNWTLDSELFIDRQAVPKVQCEVILRPALPTKVILNRALTAPSTYPLPASSSNEPVTDLRLGLPDASTRIGFHLFDQYKNAWSYNNLRGDMKTCGIRVKSIEPTTFASALTVQCEPLLEYSKEFKHWYIKNLIIDAPPVPDGEVSPLGLNSATDRITIEVKLKFEINDTAVGDRPGFTFDPRPRPESLEKLNKLEVTFQLRLGPGQASDFICEKIPEELSLTNMDTIEGLEMHLADKWHHSTSGDDMQITMSAHFQYLRWMNTSPSSLPFHFTPDHQVLTRASGWKLLPHVTLEDEVWSLLSTSPQPQQGWTRVLSIGSMETPAIMHHYENKHISLIATNSIELDGIGSAEISKPVTTQVYALNTEHKNYFIRRQTAPNLPPNTPKWSAIFVSEESTETTSDNLVTFPLPSLPGRKIYDVDPLGRVKFDSIPLNFTLQRFSDLCFELSRGEFVIEFVLLVQLQFKAEPGLHHIKSVRIQVKPRWGPIQLRILKDSSHLSKRGEKQIDSAIASSESNVIEGVANQDLTSLHLGFIADSGRFMSIAELQDGLGERAQQLHFYLDGFDGRGTHFTLADLDVNGVIVGVNLPSVLAPIKKPKHHSQAMIQEGTPRTIQAAVRMVIEEAKDAENTNTQQPVTSASLAASPPSDTIMIDMDEVESKPALSSLLPAMSLRTGITLRVRPDAPARWSIETSFPRGFKCGLVFGDYLQVCTVDKFGNRTARGDFDPATEPKLEMIVCTEAPTEGQPLPKLAPTSVPPPAPTSAPATPTRAIVAPASATTTPVSLTSAAAPVIPAISDSVAISTQENSSNASVPTVIPMEVDSSVVTNSTLTQIPPSFAPDEPMIDPAVHQPENSIASVSSTLDPSSSLAPSAIASSAIASSAVPSSSTVTAAVAVTPPTQLQNVIKNFHPSRPTLPNGSLASYYTSPSAFLVVKAGTYWLVARDAAGIYADSTPVQIEVVPGAVHKMRAFTDPECKTENEIGYDASDPALAAGARPIKVASKAKIGRIWCKFFDRGGNETIATNKQDIMMQLILPKLDERTAATSGAPPDSKASISTKPEPVDGTSAASSSSSANDDSTVSGIYSYPLLSTRRDTSSDSIFSAQPAAAAASSSSSSSSSPVVKPEFSPLPALIGRAKSSVEKDGTTAYSALIEEFTLHLNQRDMKGACLLIQSRERGLLPAATPPQAAASTAAATSPAAVAATPLASQSQKKKKASRALNDIIISLDVSPFTQEVRAIQITSVFDSDRMSAALAHDDRELALRSELLAPPVPVSPDAASTSLTSLTTPVPSGTPFPSIEVSMNLAFQHLIPHAIVKLEPGQQNPDSRVYTLPFMLPGLSIEVFHQSSDGGVARRQVNHLYAAPIFDVDTKKFRFDPISTEDESNALGESSSKSDDYVFNSSGKWLFLVRYREPREHISSILLPADCERFAQLAHDVVAGQPKRLEIDSASVRTDQEIVVGNMDPNAAASTSATFRPRASRIIASNLRLKLHDKFGQPVSFANLDQEAIEALRKIEWRVTGLQERPAIPANTASTAPNTVIVIDSDDDEPMEVAQPRLSTTQPGAVAASSVTQPVAPPPQLAPQVGVSPVTLDFTSSSIQFSDISIQPNSSGDSGRYRIDFNIPSYALFASLNFYFSNDTAALDRHIEATRTRRIAEQAILARHTAKLQEVVALQSALKQLDNENTALNSRQTKLQNDMHHFATLFEQRMSVQIDGSQLGSAAELNGIVRDTMDSLKRAQEREQQQPHVPAKQPQTLNRFPAVSRADGYHGQLVDLASIEDSKICVLASWHLGARTLGTFITSDRQCQADRLVRNACQQNRSGQVVDLAGVTQAFFDINQLPHQMVRNPATAQQPYMPRGRPRYLLSCLDFNTDDPRIQKQYMNLFFSMVNRTLIIDSMDDAKDYRQYLISNRMPCPTILCLKECKALSSNNIERFDDGAYARGLAQLEAHFAIRPSPTSRTNRGGLSPRDIEERLRYIHENSKYLDQFEVEERQIRDAHAHLNHQQVSHTLHLRLREAKAESDRIHNEMKQFGVQGITAPTQALLTATSAAIIGAPTAESLLRASHAHEQEERRKRAAQHQAERERQMSAQREAAEGRSEAQPTAAAAAASSSSAATTRSSRPVAVRGGFSRRPYS